MLDSFVLVFGSIASALAAAAPVVHNLGEIAQGGHHVWNFAERIYNRIRKKARDKGVSEAQQPALIRQALEQAARMPPAEFESRIEAIVEEEIREQPAEEKVAARAYLAQFPGRIKTSFPARDHSGQTTIPDDFIVRGPRELVQVIPPRLPRFHEGERPPGAPKYELVERLAIGGMGEVWKARHDHMKNTHRVFKFCLDPQSLRYFFENETENIELVQNELGDDPHIVKLYNAHFDDDATWLEYEYIPGGDLAQLIATWSDDIRVRATMAVETVSTLARTLARCHAGFVVDGKLKVVIHRDMKPANVLVGRDGTLKITDFGISNTQSRRAIDEALAGRGATATATTPIGLLGAGTPMYASRQQLNGEKPHPADDVHALGVMLFQMILGDPSGLLEVDYAALLERRHVRRELIDLISRSIASIQAERFQHAGELLAALEALPKPLVVEPVVEDPEARKRRQYDQLDRLFADADAKNREASQLFDRREWKRAKAVLELLPHPRFRDRELYKAVALYADGQRYKNSLGMEFAWVPPGDSWLGGGGGTPGTRKFTLDEGFWAGIYPVTQAEWQAVMNGDQPSHFKGNPRFPVESVSWETITSKFLVELNKKSQGDGYSYRLPTEDEWEYICRGGPISKDLSAFHYYFARSKADLTPNPTNDLTPKLACFGQGSSGKPSEVGSFLPNSLGIHDMHGLIWERTATAEGSSRVYRGGSWYYAAGICAAAYRGAHAPGDLHKSIGFRLLAVPLAK